jgi:hypothetical protein
VTIEEYAEEMLSCTVPDRVVQLWKDFGTYSEAEQVVTLHQMPGISEKLLWAIRHHYQHCTACGRVTEHDDCGTCLDQSCDTW